MDGKFDGKLSDGFVEGMWDTLIALAMAAGICVSVISLASHLNETRAARLVAASTATTGVASINVAPSTSGFN